jgi:hypothetical protein
VAKVCNLMSLLVEHTSHSIVSFSLVHKRYIEILPNPSNDLQDLFNSK